KIFKNANPGSAPAQTTITSKIPLPIATPTRECQNCALPETSTAQPWGDHLYTGPFTSLFNLPTFPAFISGFAIIPSPQIVCWDCAKYWLRYAVVKTIPDSVRRKNQNRKGLGVWKRKRDESDVDIKQITVIDDDVDVKAGTANSKMRFAAPVEESEEDEKEEDDEDATGLIASCAVCLHKGEVGRGNSESGLDRLIHCGGCKLTIHNVECYGLSETEAQEKFRCARCKNSRKPEAAVVYNCVLCSTTDQSSSMVSALVQTIGKNWAHVECALWIPETKFQNASKMNIVECIGMIPADPNLPPKTCSICNIQKGAVIPCSYPSCKSQIHAYCAKANGKLAITADLVAIAYCNIHVVEEPEISPDLVRRFVLKCKQNPVTLPTTALRRAYSVQLDAGCRCDVHVVVGGGNGNSDICDRKWLEWVEKVGDVNIGVDDVNVVCGQCGSDLSPIWWPLRDEGVESDDIICQNCYWEKFR
ncbi:putative PHD type zinc finger protein with BAH domain-containing protein, partial [Nowakowskiella sp. JEL0078]